MPENHYLINISSIKRFNYQRYAISFLRIFKRRHELTELPSEVAEMLRVRKRIGDFDANKTFQLLRVDRDEFAVRVLVL